MQASTLARNSGRRGAPAISPCGNGRNCRQPASAAEQAVQTGKAKLVPGFRLEADAALRPCCEKHIFEVPRLAAPVRSRARLFLASAALGYHVPFGGIQELGPDGSACWVPRRGTGGPRVARVRHGRRFCGRKKSQGTSILDQSEGG